jgi:hypothetical protein
MPQGTAAMIDRFYDAWDRHDAAVLAASFAAGGAGRRLGGACVRCPEIIGVDGKRGAATRSGR